MVRLHPEISIAHIRKIVAKRKALFNSVMEEASKGGGPSPPAAVKGKHECPYCNEPFDEQPSFERYDDLIKHIAANHPEVNIEDDDDDVPMIQKRRGPPTGTRKKLPHIPAPIPPKPKSVQFQASMGDAPLPPPPPVSKSMMAAPKPAVSAQTVPKAPSKPVPAAQAVKPPEFADDSFPCEICHKVFKNEIDLLKHLEERHPDGVSTLDDEDVESTDPTPPTGGRTPPELSAAVSSYTPTQAGAISVKCDLCTGNKVFTSEVALFSHIKFKHPQVSAQAKVKELLASSPAVPVLRCEFCNKCFASHSALHGHMAAKHGTSSPVIPQSVKGAPALEINNVMQKEQSAARNPWWCNDCDKGFGSNKALLSHLQTKHGLTVEPAQCPACKRMFPDIYSMKDHVALTHKNLDADSIGGDEDFSCSFCVRKFIHVDKLHSHVRSYHPEHAKDEEKSSITPEPVVKVSSPETSKVGSSGQDGPKAQQSPEKAEETKGEEIHPDEVLFA